MKAANPGEPAPESGRYEQVEHAGSWTGIQWLFDEGETMPSPEPGCQWVWIDPLVAECWPDAKAENEASRR